MEKIYPMEYEEIMEDVFTKIKEMKAIDFPIREVPKIKEETGCIELLDLLIEEKSPVAMVFDDKEKFLGILRIENLLSLLKPRETDISDVFARTHVLSCITAFDLVKRDLPIVKDGDDISRVAGLMDKYDTIFLPRCKERKGKIEGMIFLSDIIIALRDNWVGACMDKD